MQANTAPVQFLSPNWGTEIRGLGTHTRAAQSFRCPLKPDFSNVNQCLEAVFLSPLQTLRERQLLSQKAFVWHGKQEGKDFYWAHNRVGTAPVSAAPCGVKTAPNCEVWVGSWSYKRNIPSNCSPHFHPQLWAQITLPALLQRLHFTNTALPDNKCCPLLITKYFPSHNKSCPHPTAQSCQSMPCWLQLFK